MNMKRRFVMGIVVVLAVGFLAVAQEPVIKEKEPQVLHMIVIDKVWSPVRVGFALLSHGDKQYIAYYNSERRMVVGMRGFGDGQFVKAVLPSESDQPPRHTAETSTIQGWDSHNYITLAVDKEGYVHLSGNMHADPLLYFRSDKPEDITTMRQIKLMVGDRENRCTYPKFMDGPDGELLFHYRDGGSGNGVEIYNVYDVQTKIWRRFFDKPLIDGLGRANAYQNGPQLGPDGWYHLLWVWRDTPDAATNHDLSYARSKDLKQWETADGKPLDLPITPDDTETIVDPIPIHGGIINGCHKMGFDSSNRVVIAYHKHDQQDNTQAYAAQFAGGEWQIRQISGWEGKHIFKGGGSGPSEFGTSLSLMNISRVEDGLLGLSFSHWKAGRGILVFAENTLEPVRVDPPVNAYPSEVTKVVSDFPGMGCCLAGDSGTPVEDVVRYVLKWESLGSNRDQPREEPWPANSDLILYKSLSIISH